MAAPNETREGDSTPRAGSASLEWQQTDDPHYDIMEARPEKWLSYFVVEEGGEYAAFVSRGTTYKRIEGITKDTLPKDQAMKACEDHWHESSAGDPPTNT